MSIDYVDLIEHANRNDMYDNYLKNHKLNVTKAYNWIRENLPDLTDEDNFVEESSYYGELEEIIHQHDNSKYKKIPDSENYYDLKCEYDAYAEYFYGNQSEDNVFDFNQAWLSHIHSNPHHWQHWVLLNDEDEPQIQPLDMPYVFIVEMICDHWSFSWASEDLTEIFYWYESHKDKMMLSTKTRKTYENILFRIKEKLNELN